MSHSWIEISLLGIGTITSMSSTLIVFAMIGEIDRTKNNSSKIPLFNVPILRVIREYKTLYPRGAYLKVFFASVTLTGLTFLIFIYLVFVVFAVEAPPSR